jgi:N-acetylneuraminic acid mutarotase
MRIARVMTVCVLALAAACAPRRTEVALPPEPVWLPEEQQIGVPGVPAPTDTAPAAPARPAPRPRVAAQWVTRAPLPERRTEVSVTTDGEYVYLAGGFGPPQGEARATAPRTIWRYHPPTDAWDRLTELPEGVHHTAFVFHAGRLYVLGGFRETSFDPVANVRIYDLATGIWSEGAPMPTPRGAMGFTLHEGRIHLIGGNAAGEHAVHDHEGATLTRDNSVNVHEAYDPATNAWVRLAPMATPRNHLGAASMYGRIHAVVGRADGDFELTVHEVYDPATDRWRVGPAVPTGRSGVAVLAHEGFLYVFGGETFAGDGRTFADVERYDPRAERWQALPPMPTARHGLGAAAYGEHVYVISGGPDPGFAFSAANERLTPPSP